MAVSLYLVLFNSLLKVASELVLELLQLIEKKLSGRRA